MPHTDTLWGHFSLDAGPDDEPVTTAEAKEHMRVDGSDDDAYIGSLVTTVRRYLEKTYGVAMITQTWNYALDRFPFGPRIEIPKAPLISVGSVTYHDEDLSTSTVFDSAYYQVDTIPSPPVIVLKRGESWPSDTLRRSSGVVIRADFGYGDNASDVPEDMVHAINIGVEDLYTHRESEVTGTVVARMGFAWRALMAPFEVFAL